MSQKSSLNLSDYYPEYFSQKSPSKRLLWYPLIFQKILSDSTALCEKFSLNNYQIVTAFETDTNWLWMEKNCHIFEHLWFPSTRHHSFSFPSSNFPKAQHQRKPFFWGKVEHCFFFSGGFLAKDQLKVKRRLLSSLWHYRNSLPFFSPSALVKFCNS